MTAPLMLAIRSLIQKIGPISVAEFMRMALQHPVHGYYKIRDPLGANGDFTTAPEISQLFGEMIGLWCVDAWDKLGNPAALTLLELGPGRGTLMQDVLRAARVMPDFLQAKRVHLLESSAALRAQQAAALKDHDPQWRDDFGALPAQPLIVIANEFFDALPVEQFERTPQGWAQRFVTLQDQRLAFVLGQPDPASELLLRPFAAAPLGSVIELRPEAEALLAVLAAHIKAHGGALLLVDYGYEASPYRGTLQAHDRHRLSDPLLKPGEQDLSAHVDFGALARVCDQAKLSVSPLLAQRRYLLQMGIETRAHNLMLSAPADPVRLVTEMQRLIDPHGMGVIFKVMAATSGFEPAGWREHD